jgi:pSer/pThr/pTyr-binding forkhead associated (FHA) protein
MAYLVIAAHGKEPHRQPISGDAVTIGRALSCAIWMDDRKLSREHCRLERVNNAWNLVDLGSTNGTWMNGQRIERQRIGDGESFEAGDTRFVFHAGQYVPHNRPRDPHDVQHQERMTSQVDAMEETLPVTPSKLNGRPMPAPKPRDAEPRS